MNSMIRSAAAQRAMLAALSIAGGSISAALPGCPAPAIATPDLISHPVRLSMQYDSETGSVSLHPIDDENTSESVNGEETTVVAVVGEVKKAEFLIIDDPYVPDVTEQALQKISAAFADADLQRCFGEILSRCVPVPPIGYSVGSGAWDVANPYADTSAPVLSVLSRGGRQYAAVRPCNPPRQRGLSSRARRRQTRSRKSR